MTSRHMDWDDDEREALDPLAADLEDARERHRHDPPLDVLRAARAEALPETLQQQTIEHLASSTWSRALVDGADDGDASLDPASVDRLLTRITQDAKRGAVPGRRWRWIWAPALTLASIALVAAAVVLWRNQTPRAPEVEQDTAAPAAATPAPRPSFRLSLDKPDVKLTALALVLRGESNSGRFADDVAPGLNAYRAGDYQTAARDLEGLKSRYPKSVEIPFYLGISRLFLGDAAAAVTALESARAMNDDSFNDEAKWYLAVAYERVGRLDRARALLDRLCAGNGPFAARACAAVNTLR